MKCKCCEKNDVEIKDYRFIDSIGAQGKILVCGRCFHLNDQAFVQEYKRGLKRFEKRREGNEEVVL